MIFFLIQLQIKYSFDSLRKVGDAPLPVLNVSLAFSFPFDFSNFFIFYSLAKSTLKPF